jgi:hypothetical protein
MNPHLDRSELAKELAGHHWDLAEWDVHRPLNRCTCGLGVGNEPEEFTAHLADVAATWAEGQMQEEWGFRYERDEERSVTGKATVTMSGYNSRRSAEECMNTIRAEVPKRVVHRLVTDWKDAP